MIWKCTFLKNTTERNFKIVLLRGERRMQQVDDDNNICRTCSASPHLQRTCILLHIHSHSHIHIPLVLSCIPIPPSFIQWRIQTSTWGGGGGGGSSPTYIHTCTYIHVLFICSSRPSNKVGGGGDLKKKFFWPFRRQFGPKLRGSPRPLPWIHHSYNNPSLHLVFLPLQIKNSVPKFFCAVGKICSQVKQGFPF